MKITNKMFRYISLFSLFSLVLLVSQPVLPSKADDETVIDIWWGLTGPDGAFLEQMVNTYNETNEDGIRVETTAYFWDELFPRWIQSVEDGNPPDLVIYHINEMPQYADMNVVVPIDDLIAEVGVNMNEYSSLVQEMSRWNGQYYGIPLDIHPLALYYNVDLVEAAGLDPDKPPTNRDEFLAWAQALTKDGVYGVSAPTTNVMTFRLWYSLMYQNGGAFASDDLSTITLNSPESAEALQFIHDLVYQYQVAPVEQSDPDLDFQSGRVAMTFQGPWWINGFAETEGLHFRTAPMPVIFDKPAVWASSHFFGFSRQEDYASQLAAMKFVKWVTENAALWGLSGQIPASESARQSPEFLNSPIYPYQKAFVDSLDSIHYTPLFVQSTEIFAESDQTPLVFGWQAVMYDAIPVDVALTEIQNSLQAILDR